MNTKVRIVIAGAIAIIALGIYVATTPSMELSPTEIVDLRSFDADRAETAPQQTVVNGWLTNDLLTYAAVQQNRFAIQQNALLLAIALIGAALLFAALGHSGPGAQHQSAAVPVAQQPPIPAPNADIDTRMNQPPQV